MTGIEIPTRFDLMYPTLVAVRNLGGSAIGTDGEGSKSQG